MLQAQIGLLNPESACEEASQSLQELLESLHNVKAGSDTEQEGTIFQDDREVRLGQHLPTSTSGSAHRSTGCSSSGCSSL